MCTAATYKTKCFYFGRNLDYERGFGEQVVITPRRFPLPMRHLPDLTRHYAMIGMASVQDGYPLYYDAVNEKGLCMAGLNFVRSAVYGPCAAGKANVAQFELIPWLLGRCATAAEARDLLAESRITDDAFLPGLPPARLHWLLADREQCFAVEQTAEGLRVYEDPAGVLTNEPPFPMQLFRLNDYAQLSPQPPENRFSPALPLETYSRGMGAMGLPGDLSSPSRFVRTAFTRLNSRSGDGEAESVSQLLHILGAAAQQRGRRVRADAVYQLLQRRHRGVLLHHLRRRPAVRRGYAPRRPGRHGARLPAAGHGVAGTLSELTQKSTGRGLTAPSRLFQQGGEGDGIALRAGGDGAAMALGNAPGDGEPDAEAAGGGGPAAVSVLYVQQKSDDLRLLPPVFPALQHYSRHADPLWRSGHQPHAGRLSGKLRLFRPQLLHWPDTVGYSAKAYFLRHRRPRAQLGAAGAVPSGQRSGHLRPGDDTTGQRDALAPLAVNRPRQQKIPGAPKACRVSASHCICSQPIKARCAG